MNIKLHPGNIKLSERKSGFYSGEVHHPVALQLKKHTQAVHHSFEPVADCPACQDILRKIEKGKI